MLITGHWGGGATSQVIGPIFSSLIYLLNAAALVAASISSLIQIYELLHCQNLKMWEVVGLNADWVILKTLKMVVVAACLALKVRLSVIAHSA